MLCEALGGVAHHLVDQYELGAAGASVLQLARAAARATSKSPRTSTTRHKNAPHGALPEAVRLHAVARSPTACSRRWSNHFKDMIFLPIETSGEGEINAHSRVQMALGEAKAKAEARVRRRRSSAPAGRSTRSARTSTSIRSCGSPFYQRAAPPRGRRHGGELRAARRPTDAIATRALAPQRASRRSPAARVSRRSRCHERCPNPDSSSASTSARPP